MATESTEPFQMVPRRRRRKKRKYTPTSLSQPQKVTRLPLCWPGENATLVDDRGEAIRITVKSLTVTFRSPDQVFAKWHIHDVNGRSYPRFNCISGNKPRQLVTRIPPYRPGMWIKVREDVDHPLKGCVRRVRLLSGSVTDPTQKRLEWKLFFEHEESSVPPHYVAKRLTEEEVTQHFRKRGKRLM